MSTPLVPVNGKDRPGPYLQATASVRPGRHGDERCLQGGLPPVGLAWSYRRRTGYEPQSVTVGDHGSPGAPLVLGRRLSHRISRTISVRESRINVTESTRASSTMFIEGLCADQVVVLVNRGHEKRTSVRQRREGGSRQHSPQRERTEAVDRLSDGSLIAGMASGDTDAMAAFVRRFQARVSGLALSEVDDPGPAEEVAQDAFMRACGTRPATTRGGGGVVTWLFTITRNLSADAIRLRRDPPDRSREADGRADVRRGRARVRGTRATAGGSARTSG
jgi:hypothetical protein